MSLRYWSSVQERNLVRESIAYSKLLLFCCPPVDLSNQRRLQGDLADNDFATLSLFYSCSLLNKVNAPIEDETIPFGAPDITIADLNESDCLLILGFAKSIYRTLLKSCGLD